MTAIIQTMATPDGPFTIVADEDGAVLASGWTADADAALARVPAALRPGAVRAGTTAAAEAVDAFYAGDDGPAMSAPVRQHGTAGQLAGWRGLRRIEAGRPIAYAEFAALLGTPAAVRAAASICARNAPALFVPCHRVLRSDGSLGGFAWGVEVKRALLRREERMRGGHAA